MKILKQTVEKITEGDAKTRAAARKRLEEVEEVGAEVVLTECLSCVHNLANAKLRRQRFSIYTTTQFINLLMKEAGGRDQPSAVSCQPRTRKTRSWLNTDH